jgi:hypothetical protein
MIFLALDINSKLKRRLRSSPKINSPQPGEMETWIPIIRRLLKRGIRILGFFNNHYAGFAPGSINLFHEVWERMGTAEEEGFRRANPLVLSPSLTKSPFRSGALPPHTSAVVF